MLELVAEHNKPQAPRRCGIDIVPRENLNVDVPSDPSSLLEISSALVSSSINLQSGSSSSSSFDVEDFDVGCCHDSVALIAKRLFDSPRFTSLCDLKMEEKESQLWKKKITQQVSLECMENSMEEREIRMRLSQLIHNKFFDL